MGYLETIATQAGMAVWLLTVILIWTLAWKLIALWKSARKNHVAWFIIMALLNTAGILPILYIFIFKDLKKKKSKKKSY